MDMHAAGRHNGRGQRGLIEHGTLLKSTADAIFFVFDVEAANWAEMVLKTSAFVALLSGFSDAAHGHDGWTAAVQQTKKPWVPEIKGQLEMLYQFTSTTTSIVSGVAIQTTTTLDIAAGGLVKSS
jgi:hypothetical protein